MSVWQRIIAALGALDRLVEGDAREQFQATVRGLVGPALTRMGWEPAEGEGDRTRELRSALFEALGVLGGDVAAHEKAREIHAAYRADASTVDPNMAAAAITVIAETGTAEEFDLFCSLFESSPTPQEQIRYLYALGRFHDDALVDRALEMSISSRVRTQNAPFLVRLLLMNRTHGSVGVEVRAAALGDDERAVPQQLDRPHARGRAGAHAAARLPTTCSGSSPSTRSPQARRPSPNTSRSFGSTSRCENEKATAWLPPWGPRKAFCQQSPPKTA